MNEGVKTIVDGLCACLDDKKAVNIKTIDISRVSSLADAFILADGLNIRHVQTLADAADEFMTRSGIRVLHTEGYASGEWVLLDGGDIVVHLFSRDGRAFYNLERVWNDGQITEYGRNERDV